MAPRELSKYYIYRSQIDGQRFLVPAPTDALADAAARETDPSAVRDPRFPRAFDSQMEAGRAMALGYDNRKVDSHETSKTVRPSDVARPDPVIKKAADQHERIKRKAEEEAAKARRIEEHPDNLAETDHQGGELPDNLAETDRARSELEKAPHEMRTEVREILERAGMFGGEPELQTAIEDNAELLTGRRVVAVAGPKEIGFNQFEHPGRVDATVEALKETLRGKIGPDGLHVVTNLDRGFDMLAARAAIALKDEGLPVSLEVHTPYEARPSLWNTDARTYYEITDRADIVSVERPGKDKPSDQVIRNAVDSARSSIVQRADEVLTFHPPGASDKSVGSVVGELADILDLPVTNTYDRLAKLGAEHAALGTASLMTPPTAGERASMVVPGASAAEAGGTRMSPRPSLTPAGEPLPGSSTRRDSQGVGDTGRPGNSPRTSGGSAGAPAAGPVGSAASRVPTPLGSVVPVPPPPPPVAPESASGVPDPVAPPGQRPPMPSLADPVDFGNRLDALVTRHDFSPDEVEAMFQEAKASNRLSAAYWRSAKSLEDRPNRMNALTLLGMAEQALTPDHSHNYGFRDAIALTLQYGDTQSYSDVRRLMDLAGVTATTSPGATSADPTINRVVDQPKVPLPTPPSIDLADSPSVPMPTVQESTPHRAPAPSVPRVESRFFPEMPRVNPVAFESGARVALGITPMSHVITGGLGQAVLGTAIAHAIMPAESYTDAQRQSDYGSTAVKEMLASVAGLDPRVGGLSLANSVSHVGRFEASRALAEAGLGVAMGAAMAKGAEALASTSAPATRQLARMGGGALGWMAGALLAPVVVRAFDRLRHASEQQLGADDMGLLEASLMASDSASRLSQMATEQFDLEFSDEDGQDLDLDDDSDMPGNIDEVVDGEGEPLDYEME